MAKHTQTGRPSQFYVGTSDILKMFPSISRDLLYTLEDRGVLNPEKQRSSASRGTRSDPKRQYRERLYSPEDVRRVYLARQALLRGLKAEKAIEATLDPTTLVNSDALAIADTLLTVVDALCAGAPAATIWTLLVTHARERLDCECVTLFLPRLDESSDFAPMASSGAPPAEARPPAEWVRVVGESGHINLVTETIAADTFASQPRPHLTGAQCLSLLAVPVRRRRHAGATSGCSAVRGWLVAENRIDEAGVTSSACFFDPAMVAVAKILASLTSLVANVVPEAALRRSLLSAMEQQRSLKGFLEEVLKEAIIVTSANRGDVGWWEEGAARPYIAASLGPTSKKDEQQIAPRSVMRRAFLERTARLIPDVLLDDDYDKCDDRSASELCVPVDMARRKRPLGVINVESRQKDFFDEHDQRVLEELAEYAALYGHMLDTHNVITSVIPSRVSTPEAAATSHAGLTRLLDHIAAEQQLDRGLVFVADYPKAQLRCAAANPRDLRSTARPYELTEKSIVTAVFHDGQARLAQLDEELDISKTDIAETFASAHSIILLPLVFGPLVIGVLCAWRANAPVTKNDFERLDSYAGLAVTSITMDRELQHHKSVLESIRSVMALIATHEDRPQVLHQILEALIETAFDRARLFELMDDRHTFQCLDSASRMATEQSYRGHTVDAYTSPFGEMTLQLQPSKWQALIRRPTVEQHDPNATKFGKPLLMPWAVIPLFVGGQMFGYLACDNVHRAADIADQDLRLLEVYASLAAQVLAAGKTAPSA